MGCVKLFEDYLPRRPYHTDDLTSGLKINKKEKAKFARLIQPNGPTHRYWMVFDLDRADAGMHWDHVGAPAPNLIARNPANGHAHLLYLLQTPIRTAMDGKTAPLRYAAAIEAGLRNRLGADRGYSGLICKNPINAHWMVHQWQANPYTLDDLADYIDLTPEKAREKPVEDYGLGRNCMLFDELRAWAYKAIRSQDWPDYNQWLNACFDRATGYNVNFTTPLDISEVKHTAKSVAKWTHRNFNRRTFDDYVARTHTSEIQAIRGRKGGLVGKGGRPAIITANGNPWDELGISRASWYRLQNRK
ncbi:replication initiation protein [Pseudomonas sp. MF7451]|uniref:replication initiation protein n=1 Tax=Pseudomonas sp. MF7451 TaxID=2797538 RepID=UPI0018E8255C|nr:replication initiation protein [Pseudomonas sp. MF7451]MBJ2223394.1 replication initiation protein [Pseudomonas sp. MF7451]